MKLLFVARRYPPDVISGTETVFENLYRAACKDHEVRLVVGYTRSRSMIPDEAVGVDLRRSQKGMSHLALYRAAGAEAKRFQPDAVLSNSIEAVVPGFPSAVIVHDLNFGGGKGSLSAIARKFLYRLLCRSYQKVIAVSGATKVALKENGMPDTKLEVIHNGVDLSRFKPLPEYSSDPEKIVLCYPGRVLPGKGQHIAIEAVSKLPDDLKSRVRLNIVGTVADKAYYQKLQQRAEGLPVSFYLEVPEIVSYYQHADIILFPTMMIEGFGFTAIEGMATGKPVIWTEQPAIREATGGVGLSFPQGDSSALAARIAEMVAEPERMRQRGEEGLALVRARYSWTNAWQQYESVLRSIC